MIPKISPISDIEIMSIKENDLFEALTFLPRKILELTFEIDKLKLRYQEIYEEYNALVSTRQKKVLDHLALSVGGKKLK